MLIGITGKSGEGKSTFARFLANSIPNSEVICVDTLFFSHVLTKKSKLIALYGPQIICNGKLNTALILECPEKAKTILNECKAACVKELLSIIDCTLAQNRIVIVEWLQLPSITELWEICDIHILVKADKQNIRYEYLLQRHAKKNNLETSFSFSKEQLTQRDSFASDYNKYSFEYTIINYYNESFQEESADLGYEIKE